MRTLWKRVNRLKPKQQYGDLTTLSRSYKKGNKWYWSVVCSCGVVKDVRADNLRSGSAQSCGCKRNRPRRRVSKWKGMELYG